MKINFRQTDKEKNEKELLHWLNHFQLDNTAVEPQSPEAFSQAAFDVTGQQIGGVIAKKWMNTCHIHLLTVDPAFRKQKIGTELLLQVEKYARSKNVRYITVHTQDYQAKTFYKRFNYQVFGCIPDMPFSGTTKYYFVKDLLQFPS